MAGITARPYIGGLTITRGPADYGEESGYAKREERLADGTLVSHYHQPEDGDPDVLVKQTWTLRLDNLRTADTQHVRRLVRRAGMFDFCPWVDDCETFTFTAGDAYSGVLRRRNALDFVSPLPPRAATKFALAAQLNGATKAITLGTVANYRTPWTATGTASEGDVISVLYYPIYRVKNTNERPSYALPQRQGWALTLEEV